MAASNFLGTKSEHDDISHLATIEHRHIELALTEEYGLPQEPRSPWLASLTTFSAFVICGLAPLIPFLINVSKPLRLSILITSAVFFGIGSVKSRWSTVPWWRSGFLTLSVGGIAAGLSYAVGVLLKNLVT